MHIYLYRGLRNQDVHISTRTSYEIKGHSKVQGAPPLRVDSRRRPAVSSFIFLTTLNRVNLRVCVYFQCFAHANCVDFSQFAWSTQPSNQNVHFFSLSLHSLPRRGS